MTPPASVLRVALLLAVAAGVAPNPAVGQSAAPLARGRIAADRAPGVALAHFEAALRLDSLDYEANWRAAVAAVEFALETGDSLGRVTRDSLYRHAAGYARRAVRVDSTRAEGYFALAMALGRMAQAAPGRDRLELAADVHAAAERAHALAPDHDGVHHVLGLWHAEAMRTSGVARFMARTILGARVLGQASWARAVEHLEQAVRLDPGRIYHRLDLGRVYADRRRYGDALAHLDTIMELPDRVALDPRYREEAVALRVSVVRKVNAARDGAARDE